MIGESHSVVSDSLRPHGLYSPWNSPGQNTGVGSLSLSPADGPDPGIQLGSPALQMDSLPTELSGKCVCVCVCVSGSLYCTPETNTIL